MWDVGSFKRIKHFVNKVHLESKASSTLVNLSQPLNSFSAILTHLNQCEPAAGLPPITLCFLITVVQISEIPVLHNL